MELILIIVLLVVLLGGGFGFYRGGYIGNPSGSQYVPFDTLKFAGKKVTLPGGTKAELEKLSVFKYATE